MKNHAKLRIFPHKTTFFKNYFKKFFQEQKNSLIND